MFKRASLLCVAFSFLSTTTQAWSQIGSPPNTLRILVVGEPSLSSSIIEATRRINAKYDLKFEFVDEPHAQHDLKLIVSGGNGEAQIHCDPCSITVFPSAQYYYNSIVALSPDGKLLFTVSRSGSSAPEVVEYAATVAIRNIYGQSTLLKKQSTFNSGAPQDTVKPIVPTQALEATAQGLPAEPGVYYKDGVDWIRLTTPSTRLNVKGFALSRIRASKVYAGASAKAQVAELKPEFYVRDFTVSEQEIRLVRLETKKDHREAQAERQTDSVYGYKANDTHRVKVTRVSNGVYKITPASELPAGEYTLILYESYLEGHEYEFGITLSKK